MNKNSIIAILTAIAQFDITQVDPNKLAMAAQIQADLGRIAYHAIRVITVIALNMR